MDSASAFPKDYTYLNQLAKTRELSEQDWERVNLILGQHPLPIQRFYRAVEWLKGKPALPVSSSPPAKTPPVDKNIDFVLYPKKNGKNSTIWSSTDSDPIADMIEWKKKVVGKLNDYHAPYQWKFNEHQDHIHVDNSYYEPPEYIKENMKSMGVSSGIVDEMDSWTKATGEYLMKYQPVLNEPIIPNIKLT